MLSYDERPGIQAIATTAPDLPPKPGKHAMVSRDHECKRLGTLTLSAAVDPVSGFVHHVVTQRHRSREFVAFLERLDAHCPAGMLICLVLDNHSAHCSRDIVNLVGAPESRGARLIYTSHLRLNLVLQSFALAALIKARS